MAQLPPQTPPPVGKGTPSPHTPHPSAPAAPRAPPQMKFLDPPLALSATECGNTEGLRWPVSVATHFDFVNLVQ